MNKRITSLDNKDIKKLIKLVNKPRLRKESKSFVVEGKRELEMAFSNGYLIKKIYCNPNIVDPKTVKSKYDSEIIEVNNNLENDAAIINQDAENEGWIFKMKISDSNQYSELMSEDEYKQFLEQ